MSRGKFIIFEGGDSVGKSTQVGYLSQWLGERRIEHITTRQPGGTPLGSLIRDLVLDPAHGDVAPWTETLLYAADKAQHVYEVIEPMLSSGKVVVCDRYVDSTLAYQGAGRNIDMDKVEQVSRFATGGLRGDLTIVLDADPAVALAKIRTKDRLEQAGAEFHADVRKFFLDKAAADPERYVVVPALGNRAEIAAEIAGHVSRLLGIGDES